VIYGILSCRSFIGVFGWQHSHGYFQILLIPSSEILCQIKKWFGTNDDRALDNTEYVLNYEQNERFSV
jgi:hypothetical protein